MSDVVIAEGLTKHSSSRAVVDRFDLRVPRGSVHGLIGPNGCGKTTTLRLLLGLLHPDEGHSTVFGEDSKLLSADARRRIGYLSDDGFEIDDLPLPYLCRFVAAFRPTWDHDLAERLIERLDVPLGTEIGDLSKGEQRRAEIVLSLAFRPELLILDEPALGLDTDVRREFLDLILETARENGTTVLLTSHVLTDLERVIDRVTFMVDGRNELSGELDELKARSRRIRLPAAARHDVTPLHGEAHRHIDGDDLLVLVTDFDPVTPVELEAAGYEPSVEPLNLEELFLDLVRGRKKGPPQA